MYSSARLPRRSNGTPTASNSSFSQPTPMPSSMRPPLRKSMVATCLASTSGLRCGRISTPVMNLSRVVAAATQVIQISGSGIGLSGPPGSRPLGA